MYMKNTPQHTQSQELFSDSGSDAPVSVFEADLDRTKIVPVGVSSLDQDCLKKKPCIPSETRTAKPSALTLLSVEQVTRFRKRFLKESTKMNKCRSGGVVHSHIEGCLANVYVPTRCESKWEQKCFREWAAESEAEIAEISGGFQYPVHIVLTEQNCVQGGLSDGMKSLQASFKRLKQRKAWKRSVRGYVYTWGLTIGKAGTWHPHLHIAADVQWFEGIYDEWRSSTRGKGQHAKIVRWKTSPADLARELVKGTKGDMKNLMKRFRKDEILFGEAIEAFTNRRWFQTGGECYKRKKKTPDKTMSCPCCGRTYWSWEWRIRSVTDEVARSLIERHEVYEGFGYDNEISEHRGPPLRWKGA